MREQYGETLRVFNEVNAVEKTLWQKIITALEPSYLAALRNRQTNSINSSIDQIISHLCDTYGNVTPRSLEDYEDRVKQMIYDPMQPIDEVFNAVVDLVDYSDAAQAPYTQKQTINIAYIILSRPGKFGKLILKWNRPGRNQKTRLHFKIYFRQAQKEYRELYITRLLPNLNSIKPTRDNKLSKVYAMNWLSTTLKIIKQQILIRTCFCYVTTSPQHPKTKVLTLLVSHVELHVWFNTLTSFKITH